MTPWTLAVGEHLYGFEGTTAEIIFIGGFALVVIIAALMLKISIRHWLITGALFATALTAPVALNKTEYVQTWLLSVQIRRAEIHLAFGVLLTLTVLFRGGFAAAHVPFQGIMLLIMGLYAGALQFVHVDVTGATQTILFVLATIPCMIVAVPLLARDYDGCIKLLKTMMWVSVVWTFCCSVQFVLDPRALLNEQGRFWGMLANAQQAALLVSPLAITSLWMLLNDPQKRTKVLWTGLLAINLLFLVWTGSRTGALSFVVGASFVLYSRIGKAVLLLPVAALLVWGLFTLAVELKIYENLERLVSTENTREQVWTNMLTNALENPLIGVGFSDAGGSENSYLLGFASYGIAYFLMTIILLLGSMWLCFNLLRGRNYLEPQHRTLVDLFIGFNAMYFASAMFEGFMLGRSSTMQTMLLIFAGIGVWLKEEIAYQRSLGKVVGEEDEHYGEPYESESPATA